MRKVGRSSLIGHQSFGDHRGGGTSFRPTRENAFWWGIFDRDITLTGGFVTGVGDQTPLHNNLGVISSGFVNPPTVAAAAINGRNCVRFQTTGGFRFLKNTTNYPLAPNGPMSVYTVVKPLNTTGGVLFSVPFQGGYIVYAPSMFRFAATQYGLLGGNAINDNPFTGAAVDYTNQPILVSHFTDGTNVWCEVNGVDRPMSPTTIIAMGSSPPTGFAVGGLMPAGNVLLGLDADMGEQISYRENQRATPKQAQNELYLRTEWGVT